MSDLSDSVNWSETDANNNSAPPNGWPEGMMPSGVNDAARADRGAMKRFWDKINPVQKIGPSGGIYTFVTANPAYPTGYVDGEIYYFHSTGASVGGDQFQVNGLGPKPIWKRVASHLWSLIIAQDILVGSAVQVVYDAGLGTGAGGFLLVNPFVPIIGDGADGVALGNLTVTGVLTMLGPVLANDGMLITGNLAVTGQVGATGYTSRSGTAGPYQTNAFNIQWAGADGAHLWIDTTDEGQIVTSSGGDIVIDGDISAGNITASGDISAATLSVSGDTTFADITVTDRAALWQVDFGASESTRTGFFDGSNGTFSANGNATIGGNVVCASLTASSTGGLGGGVSIYATNGAFRSDVSGTALYLPSGNVVCQSVTAANNITLGAASVPTLVQTGNYVVVYAADAPGGLQGCFIVGNALDATNYSRNTFHKFDNRAGGFTYATFNAGPPYCYKPGGGTWGDSSDVRLKHHVEDYTSGLAEIDRLRPVRFRFNGKGGTTDDGTVFTGLVADEVRDVMPEMVGTMQAKLNPGDAHDTELLTLDATSLIYALVNSVKELAERVLQLETR